MNEDKFYKELKETPKLPDKLFMKISTEIDNRKKESRIFYAIAASLIIAVGVMVYNQNSITPKPLTKIAFSQESLNELQVIDDYLSGRVIDEEFDDIYSSYLY